MLQAALDGGVVVAAGVPVLLDPGQDEDLVVHSQPESDADGGDHDVGFHTPDRGEAEQTGQVPLLEDPHEDPDRGGQGQGVDDQSLERDEHRSGHEEEQHEGCQGDDGDHPGQAVQHGGAEVQLAGRLPGHPGVGGGGQVPHRLDGPLAGGLRTVSGQVEVDHGVLPGGGGLEHRVHPRGGSDLVIDEGGHLLPGRGDDEGGVLLLGGGIVLLQDREVGALGRGAGQQLGGGGEQVHAAHWQRQGDQDEEAGSQHEPGHPVDRTRQA